MKQAQLGGLAVSAEGLGCMGMSSVYGAADWDESVATIRRALDLGVTLIDTANAYGIGHNEVLVGRAIAGRRSEVQVATKVGMDLTTGRAGSSSGMTPATSRRPPTLPCSASAPRLSTCTTCEAS